MAELTFAKCLERFLRIRDTRYELFSYHLLSHRLALKDSVMQICCLNRQSGSSGVESPVIVVICRLPSLDCFCDWGLPAALPTTPQSVC